MIPAVTRRDRRQRGTCFTRQRAPRAGDHFVPDAASGLASAHRRPGHHARRRASGDRSSTRAMTPRRAVLIILTSPKHKSAAEPLKYESTRRRMRAFRAFRDRRRRRKDARPKPNAGLREPSRESSWAPPRLMEQAGHRGGDCVLLMDAAVRRRGRRAAGARPTRASRAGRARPLHPRQRSRAAVRRAGCCFHADTSGALRARSRPFAAVNSPWFRFPG